MVLVVCAPVPLLCRAPLISQLVFVKGLATPALLLLLLLLLGGTCVAASAAVGAADGAGSTAASGLRLPLVLALLLLLSLLELFRSLMPAFLLVLLPGVCC